MLDSSIKLIKIKYETDEFLNQIETTEYRDVFCKVRNATRVEFYGAGIDDLRADFVFVLSDYREYQNEKYCKYVGVDGIERTYKITRAYMNVSRIELNARETAP